MVPGERRPSCASRGTMRIPRAQKCADYMSREQFDKMMIQTEKRMKEAAKDLDFLSAAQFRDELFALKKKFKDRDGLLKD